MGIVMEIERGCRWLGSLN